MITIAHGHMYIYTYTRMHINVIVWMFRNVCAAALAGEAEHREVTARLRSELRLAERSLLKTDPRNEA